MKHLVPCLLLLATACTAPKASSGDAVLSAATGPAVERPKPEHAPAHPSARYLSSWPGHSPFCCITMGMHCNCILPVQGQQPLPEVDELDVVEPDLVDPR